MDEDTLKFLKELLHIVKGSNPDSPLTLESLIDNHLRLKQRAFESRNKKWAVLEYLSEKQREVFTTSKIFRESSCIVTEQYTLVPYKEYSRWYDQWEDKIEEVS